MEIDLERKYMSIYKKISGKSKTVELTADMIVPDTKEDILRIVYNDSRYKIISKDTENGRVRITGEIALNTAYLAEKGAGISTLHADIPFDCDFEDDTVNSSCATVADIRIVSCEIRMINTRKVIAKVVLCVEYTAYEIGDMTWYEKPTESQDGVYFKTETVKAVLINNVCEKTISLEDEMRLDEAGENAELICAGAAFFEQSADAVGSKLIIKGKADITLIYSENGIINSVNKSTSFSQVFDLSERDIVPEHRLKILPTGEYFRLDGGVLSYELHAVIQLVCSGEKEFSYISDAYACKAELAADVQDICIVCAHCTRKNAEKISLTHTDEKGIEKLCFAKAEVSAVKQNDEDTLVSINADVIYVCDGELKCARVPGQGSFHIDGEAVSSEIVSVTAYKSGNEISITAELMLTYEITQSKTIHMITAASAEEKENEEKSASLYLAKADDLWTLAKKYRSDVELIKKVNDIENDDDISKNMLLIPKIV